MLSFCDCPHRFHRVLPLILMALAAGFAMALWPATASVAAAATEPGPDPSRTIVADFVLKGGTLVDGTGAAGRVADVAVRGDRIVAVGTFQTGSGTRVIDCRARIVAPGFIDLHNHSDAGIVAAGTRVNRNFLAQGVTTIVTGNCGLGTNDVEKYLSTLELRGAGTNVIHLIPHGVVRSTVMGNADRAPSASELERMKRIVEKGMAAGAWGLSSGLIYVPGRYAETNELIELCRVVHRHGGLYASHIRNEGTRLLESIDEAINIGKQSGIPVHISHLKANGKASWGRIGAAIERIQAVRGAGMIVTADQYPYIASSTQLAAMVIPHWAIQGNAESFTRLAADPQRGEALRREIQKALDERDGGASITIARYKPRPDRIGKNLVAIAQHEGTTPLEVVLDIQRHGGAPAISFGMDENDVREAMRHDFVATASDGSAHMPGNGDQPHPRATARFRARSGTHSTTRSSPSSRRSVRAPAGRRRFSGFPIAA